MKLQGGGRISSGSHPLRRDILKGQSLRRRQRASKIRVSEKNLTLLTQFTRNSHVFTQSSVTIPQ